MSFGQELCEAWGLDADKVTQIEVVIEPSRVIAYVTLHVDAEASRKLLELRPARTDSEEST